MSKTPSLLIRLSFLVLAASGSAAGQDLIAIRPAVGGASAGLGITLSPGFGVSSLPNLPVPAVESLDFQPGTGTMFAVGGPAPAHLFRIVPRTGAIIDVGSTGESRVPGLAFADDGTLYGVSPEAGQTAASRLLIINPFLGVTLPIGTLGSSGGLQIRGVEALAYDPAGDQLLGLAGAAFDGLEGTLIAIDRFSGQAAVLGGITDAQGQRPPAPVTGIGRPGGGHVLAGLGGSDGRIIDIDLATRQFTFVGDSGTSGVTAIAPMPQSRLIGLGSDFLFDTRVFALTSEPFSGAEIGQAGVADLVGLAFQPATGRLFASSGAVDGGRLFEIDRTTQLATLIGATGFPRVSALAFDRRGRLFGAAAPTAITTADRLIAIDIATGAATQVGTFGGGVQDMEALALDPQSGELRGVGTRPLFGQTLFSIDLGSGQAQAIASLDSPLGPPAATVLGMAFDAEGRLYGALDQTGLIIEIDPLTATFDPIGPGPNAVPTTDLASFQIPAVDIGFGKPGGNGGAPRLLAVGSLEAGGLATFRLEAVPGGTLAVLVLGPGVAMQPFLGGFLLPSPITVPGAFITSPAGDLELQQVGGFVPPGLAGTLQFVVYDPGATFQTSISNGLIFLYP